VGDGIAVMCEADGGWFIELAQVEGIWLKPSFGKRTLNEDQRSSTAVLPSIPSGSTPTRQASLNDSRALFRVGYMQRAAQTTTWPSVPKQLQQKFKGPSQRGRLLRYIGRRETSVDIFSARFILCKLKIEPATLGKQGLRVPYYYVADADDLKAASELAKRWSSESDSEAEEEETERKGKSSKKRTAASLPRNLSKHKKQRL
jgi:hypothetical protein